MPTFEPKRKLSEEQKVFLQDNHQLIYKGLYRINSGKASPLSEEEIGDCVVNVVRQFCMYNQSLSKQSTFIYRACQFAYKGAVKKRGLCREKGLRKCVSYNRPTFNKAGDFLTYLDILESKTTADRECLTEELSVALHNAIGSLPNVMRSCIKARAFEKKTMSQIGAEHNKTSSWAHLTIGKALSQLRENLHEWKDNDQTFPN